MLKSRTVKTAYTGLSLTDLGFSGRILEKYGFFSDDFSTALALIFRKDKAHGKTGGTAIYRNVFNRTLIFRFLGIGSNGGVVSIHRRNEAGDYNSTPVWFNRRQQLQGSFNTPLQLGERDHFTSVTGHRPRKDAGDVFSPRYNSHSPGNYIPKLNSLTGPPEASGSINLAPVGPGFKYITAWYLKLQRYIKAESHTSPAGYQIYPSTGEAGKRLPGNGAGYQIFLKRREGRSIDLRAGNEAKRMESVSPLETEPKPIQYQTQTGSMFSRSLVRFDIGRQYCARQQIKSEIFNITGNLHAKTMNYKTEKYYADYTITSLDNYHNAPDRRPRDLNALNPGYLKRYRFERPPAGYQHWLEWYQISSWNRIQRAEAELAFERQVLENYRQKLTNSLIYLSLEINKNKPDRQVPEFDQKSAVWMGRNPGSLTYTQRRLQEKTRLKRELQRISELLSVQEKPAAGDTQITGGLPGSPLDLGVPENHVMLGKAGISDTIQLSGPSNPRPGSSTAGLGTLKPAPDNGMPETESRLINRDLLNLTGPGTAADRIFLQNLRYDRLLNEKRLQETAIWRREQQLLKLREIQHYMNLQQRRLKRDPVFSFNMKHFLTGRNSQNSFYNYGNQPVKNDFFINQKLYRYGKTLLLSESLNRLEQLIRYEYRQQYPTRIPADKFGKGGIFALTDEKSTRKTEVYDLLIKTTGSLSSAGSYSKQSHKLPVQHRIWSRPGRFIAEVMERGQVIHISDYEYESKCSLKKSTDLSMKIWDRIRYNSKTARIWNNSGINITKKLGNTTIATRYGIEQMSGPSNPRPETGTVGLGTPKPVPDNGTQETAIWRREQQLLKIREIQDYMNLQRRRLKRDPVFYFNIKHFLTGRNSQNSFYNYGNQPVKNDFFINQKLYRYSKTLLLSESLNRLEQLIRYEYRPQYPTRFSADKFGEGETFALTDEKTTSKTEVYNLLIKTTGSLSLAGPYSNHSHKLPVQHRIWSRPSRVEDEVIESKGLDSVGNPPEFKQKAKHGLPVRQHSNLSVPGRFIAEVMERGQLIQSYSKKKSVFYQKEIQRQVGAWRTIESEGAGYPGKQTEFEQISRGKPGIRQDAKQTATGQERDKSRYLKQTNISDYEYEIKRSLKRKKSTNLSMEIGDRIRYNSKTASIWNNSGINIIKILGNTTMTTRSGIEQMRKISLNDHTGSGNRQIPVNSKEWGMPPKIIVQSNMHFNQMDSGIFKTSRKGLELKRARPTMPGIEAADNLPEDFAKYSPMDFHRPVKEPDSEPSPAKTQNEEIVSDQVYRYEGEIKIDPANMERIVNNVYNEIERRLEFERQRRGL